MFGKLFKTAGRATRCYSEAVMGQWPQWELQWSEGHPKIIAYVRLGTLQLDKVIESTVYRRLMTAFWVFVINQDAPWDEFDIQSTFQAERAGRQEMAQRWVSDIRRAVVGHDLGEASPDYAPIVVARRTMDDTEFLKFMAYEYVAMTVANVAIQQVMPWRQQNGDRPGWTKAEVAEFYAAHDCQVDRRLSKYKETAGWDEILVTFKYTGVRK